MPEVNGCDVPSNLAAWLQPFKGGFTTPTWQYVQVLVMGAILVPGRRTVASALRVMGLSQILNFTNYHRVLNRNVWSSRWLSQRLLLRLVNAFFPDGKPVVIGLDDSIERRWGGSIKARGIYRDAVRSSRSHLVKVSGLRWLSIMALPEIPWAGRCWALPFLSLLAPSRRYWQEHKKDKREPKKLTDWARQGLIQVARWLPGRRIIAVGDAAFASIELLDDVRPWVTMITRLRLDAALYNPPPRRKPGTLGRPRVVGKRQPSLEKRFARSKTRWCRLVVTGWYGRGERTLDVASGTALWAKSGHRVLIRYVMVRDPERKLAPAAFLSTDTEADPLDILRLFVRRWSIEVTFAEVRRHLGVETQRQWSDLAIARTTPFLLGLFSLITLCADELFTTRAPAVRLASWYRKSLPTFSDALANIRHELWTGSILRGSRQRPDPTKIPSANLNALIDLACYVA
jgi:hypothetical protein